MSLDDETKRTTGLNISLGRWGALLSAVLERIKPEIYRSGYICCFVFVNTENTAFLVDAVKHFYTSVTNIVR